MWKIKMKRTNIEKSSSGEKSDLPVYAYSIISFPYVSGDINAIFWPIRGILDIGTKTPEIKISGSLTVLSRAITSPAVSVGYAANNVPSIAKQNAVRIIEITRIGAFNIRVSKIKWPTASGKHAMPRL